MLNASKLQSSWCCHSNWRPNQYSNVFFFWLNAAIPTRGILRATWLCQIISNEHFILFWFVGNEIWTGWKWILTRAHRPCEASVLTKEARIVFFHSCVVKRESFMLLFCGLFCMSHVSHSPPAFVRPCSRGVGASPWRWKCEWVCTYTQTHMATYLSVV